MLGARVWKGRFPCSWLKVKTEPERSESGFAPRLSVIRNNGWVSLELLLVNNVSMMTWVEDAMVVLTDLDANWQTSIQAGQARHKIRQYVRANETLRVSIAGAIYDAAGRPQAEYSCLVSVVLCYRLGNEWFDKALDACRVEMAALTVLGLRP